MGRATQLRIEIDCSGKLGKLLLLAIGCVFGFFVDARIAVAQPQPISLNDPLPYGEQPVDYFSDERPKGLKSPTFDSSKWTWNEHTGYLTDVLKHFDIPVESQALVFSKTALNPRLVSPKTPRAIYWNENAYVGYVPGAAALEIAIVDPKRGWLFFTLKQRKAEESLPEFHRERQCLACHAGQSTLRIPGGLVRGFITDRDGKPKSGYSRITHDSAFEKRFGGWYITGNIPHESHRGNRIEVSASHQSLLKTKNFVLDLDEILDCTPYLTNTSDVVTQMLLHHQIHGQNLLIRVGFEARFGKRSDAEERLLRYLLFVHEAALPQAFETSTFAEWFAGRGKIDSKGRSLRDLELKTRLFQYRLSYLIQTELFDGLPKTVKRRLYNRLWTILSAKSPPKPFGTIPWEERQAILGIVRETKTDLPAAWQHFRRSGS